MKIWIQWAMANPQDYVMYDLGSNNPNVIRDIPSKPEPPGGQGTVTLDNTPGWVASINVQGVIFSGYEHYGMAYNRQSRTCTIGAWNDEVADNPDGPYMTAWSFEFPRNDPKLNSINTVQSSALYVETGSGYAIWLDSHNIPWLPWEQRPTFNSLAVRHCPWLSDAQYQAHAENRNEHVWDEWIGQ